MSDLTFLKYGFQIDSSSLTVAELICILLKLALRKAFTTSSAVSLSCLSFWISVWYILFSILVESWIFFKFLSFVSTSVLFSSSFPFCSCFLSSLIATPNCFCSLSFLQMQCVSYGFSLSTLTIYNSHLFYFFMSYYCFSTLASFYIHIADIIFYNFLMVLHIMQHLF